MPRVWGTWSKVSERGSKSLKTINSLVKRQVFSSQWLIMRLNNSNENRSRRLKMNRNMAISISSTTIMQSIRSLTTKHVTMRRRNWSTSSQKQWAIWALWTSGQLSSRSLCLWPSCVSGCECMSISLPSLCGSIFCRSLSLSLTLLGMRSNSNMLLIMSCKKCPSSSWECLSIHWSSSSWL